MEPTQNCCCTPALVRSTCIQQSGLYLYDSISTLLSLHHTFRFRGICPWSSSSSIFKIGHHDVASDWHHRDKIFQDQHPDSTWLH